MNEDRKRILTMVANGKVSVDEAEELLHTLGDSAGASATKKNLKYLRVTVNNPKGDNVNVKVPMGLLRAGLKLSSLIPVQAYDQINNRIAEHGINIDLNNLKHADLEQLIEEMADMNIDVTSASGDIVKVYFE
jgi:hypothetical protein